MQLRDWVLERNAPESHEQNVGKQDAGDAVKESFLKVHRAAARSNGEAAFRAWLWRIVANTLNDMLRKRSRKIRATPINAVPLNALLAEFDQELAVLQFAGASEKLQSVFRSTPAEIADAANAATQRKG